MEDKIKLKKLEAHLANERTFLSYTRTTASVVVLAVALIKFFEEKIVIYIGFVVLIVGILILILGIYRYFQERKHIARLDLS